MSAQAPQGTTASGSGPGGAVAPGLETDPAALARLPDAELLDRVARQTFRFFWEGAHPGSGLAPDRRAGLHETGNETVDDLVTTGGSGFSKTTFVFKINQFLSS